MGERPKRRKHKDNPYTLEYCSERNICKVSFKDSRGVHQIVEVNKNIFMAMDRFELDDLSDLNEYDNHIEHSEIYENNLNTRAVDKPISLEEIVENKLQNEKLYKAISKLPEIQKRRIKMYYFENMTLKEIAEIEHCHLMSVKDSITYGIEKLKKYLN